MPATTARSASRVHQDPLVQRELAAYQAPRVTREHQELLATLVSPAKLAPRASAVAEGTAAKSASLALSVRRVRWAPAALLVPEASPAPRAALACVGLQASPASAARKA